MREIVLDTETTGLDPLEGHRLLEIGAVEIVDQVPTGNVYHRLINPERSVPAEAVAVHGHTWDALKDKPLFPEVVDELLLFIGESPLVIHNALFDLGFLNAELARIARMPIESRRVVDTLELARKKHPGLPNTLDSLCDRYRINRSRRIKHGALVDAQILSEVYCELKGGIQRSLSLIQEAEPSLAIVAAQQLKRADSVSRLYFVDSNEARAHAEHLKALGEGVLWVRYMTQPSL